MFLIHHVFNIVIHDNMSIKFWIFIFHYFYTYKFMN